jgi:hypothetical protein
MENGQLIKRQRIVLENGVSVLAERFMDNDEYKTIHEYIRFVKKGTSQIITTKSVIRYGYYPKASFEEYNSLTGGFRITKESLLDYYNHQFVHRRFENN